MSELAEDEANPEKPGEKWAYATPIIEQGSLLLSAPGDHFALNQQYFHKTLILILKHDERFTQGVILNRPTAFSTHDLVSLPEGVLKQADWNVWCGGDCEGFNTQSGDVSYTCLHSLERLTNMSEEVYKGEEVFKSEEVFKGVYLIDLEGAQRLVENKDADKDDFLLLVGYCGWGPGQLQGELDRGDTWTMAAASPKQLLGELRKSQAELTRRLEGVLRSRAEGSLFAVTAETVGDGLSEWARLYEALGRQYAEEMSSPSMVGQMEHVDEMLRRWINRCLIPARYRLPEELSPQDDSADAAVAIDKLQPFDVLRGSATGWLLGKPAEGRLFNRPFTIPGQYMHKSVLVLLTEVEERAPAWLLLLNGPRIAPSPDGRCDGIRYGGINPLGERGAKVLELQGAGGSVHRFQGLVPLMYDELQALLKHRALTPIHDVKYQDLLDLPASERWTAANGKVLSILDARTAQLGDVQKRMWYKRFLNLDLTDEVQGVDTDEDAE